MRGMVAVADAVRSEDGKVSALGAFWDSACEGPVRMDLLLLIRPDADEAQLPHSFKLALKRREVDGDPLVELRGSFALARESGAPEGVAPVLSRAIPMRDIELQSGAYFWELAVDDVVLDEWSFAVTPRPEAVEPSPEVQRATAPPAKAAAGRGRAAKKGRPAQ